MPNSSLNWKAIKKEISKFGSADDVRAEFQKLVKELNKVDINSYLSPEAKRRLADLENRYHRFMTSLNRTQRDLDREFDRLSKLVKQRKSEVESVFGSYKATAAHKKKAAKKKVTRKVKGARRAARKTKRR